MTVVNGSPTHLLSPELWWDGEGFGMLGRLAEQYVRGRLARGEIAMLTARNNRVVLTQFAAVANVAPERLDRRHVHRWQEHYAHLAQSTKRNRLVVVRSFCRWLLEEGHAPRNACAGVKPLKEPRRAPRALDGDAVAKIILSCEDTRDRLAVMLMVQEGMRRGEVARLELGDFDLSHRLVTVTGKGGNMRVLHVTDQTMTALRDHLAVEGDVAGPLFRSRHFPTQALHPDTVSMLVRRAMERAGVKRAPRDGVSPHSLRHTSLTDMLLNGAHARDVQHVAGHQHLATTERYLPMAVGTLAATMDGRWYGPDLS